MIWYKTNRGTRRLKNKTLWPLFMDGVLLPQGYSHFEEAVYFLPFNIINYMEDNVV